jgi:hypothetical protein
VPEVVRLAHPARWDVDGQGEVDEAAELEPILAPMREQLATLQSENARLREELRNSK